MIVLGLSDLTFNEPALAFFESFAGPVGRHAFGIAEQVRTRAIIHASGRPGPRIRTGDLVEGMRVSPGQDADGIFFDVGSIAIHRGEFYPRYLESGERGYRYPFLTPAIAEVFALMP